VREGNTGPGSGVGVTPGGGAGVGGALGSSRSLPRGAVDGVSPCWEAGESRLLVAGFFGFAF
jgi:hypothetical protein